MQIYLHTLIGALFGAAVAMPLAMSLAGYRPMRLL
jgi:hypothetical protein